MQKLNSKTLYLGSIVCLISTLNEQKHTNITPISSFYNVNDTIMIGLNTTSKGYENIKLFKKALINIPILSMWENIEKIANFTYSSWNDQKTQNFIEDKTKVGQFTLLKSVNEIQYIKDSILYYDVEYINELVVNGVANICLQVNGIYINPLFIDSEGFINENKITPLIYQFRKYKKISEKEFGRSFRYSKAKWSINNYINF